MHSAIDEVIRSLAEALIIVTLVVFLFLGSMRSSLIPTVAIPLSLVGTLIILLALGYSINLLTLLALVLAIGLVVDDAIIVVENVNRHLEEGMAPMPAAIQAARELGGPIIAMTVVLAAVYVPIGFQSGLTGALFAEFAFALVGAVTVSGIVALTLSPMLCSRLLKAHDPERGGWEARLTAFIDRQFHRLRGGYERRLHGSLNYAAGDAGVRRRSCWSASISSSPAPRPSSRRPKTRASSSRIDRRAERHAAAAPALFARSLQDLRVASGNRARLPARRARPVDRRHGVQALGPAHARRPMSCSRSCSRSCSKIAGVRVAAFQPPALPGSFGLPVQFVHRHHRSVRAPQRRRRSSSCSRRSRAACSSSSIAI